MKDVPGLVRDWDFVPTPGVWWLRTRRLARAMSRARRGPAHSVLKPLTARDSWIVYFIYSPDGSVSQSHWFTLKRLRDLNSALMVICATRTPDNLDASLAPFADALYWKHLSGYDFSAYSLGLREIGKSSPGATALFLNDSVMGPFQNLTTFMRQTRWDLAGMTASSLVENHLQSYAFIIRGVDAERIRQLRRAFPETRAYDRAGDVILCQETYFARLASHRMRVGSFWYAPTPAVPDPTLTRPIELLDAGFPFLKKSVFGKHSKFQSDHARETLHERLRLEGHPEIGS